MKAANLTRLLIRARDAGLTVQVDKVDNGDLFVWPVRALTPELRAELLRYKPELLKLLTWSESTAHTLLKDAAAYLNEFYLEAGPECDLVGLDPHEAAIDAAMMESDMFALRCAVREWVRAGVAMFRSKERDRGAA